MNGEHLQARECERIADLVDSMINIQLAIALTPPLMFHLSVCRSCSQRLSEVMHLRRTLKRAAMRDSVPADLRSRIQSQLRASVRPEERLERSAAEAKCRQIIVNCEEG